MSAVGLENASKIESCDFQLGDTWRGMQSKMSVTSPVKKIRKKSDNKPQSQINKCTNEKKRRELENETINQLQELLETRSAEVRQPDKNGIVREATRQIEEVLKRRRECPDQCPLRALCRSPVQAGEVTSTQPPPASLHYSELTTLIEALKCYTNSLGLVLLEINNKGEIECVTENIKDLVLQDRTELYKKSIFSLVHESDHEKLRPLLRNVQTFSWAAAEPDKFQAIQARLLVKNANGSDLVREVESVIHAAAVRGSSAEEAGSVMCVIRRHDAPAALLPADRGRQPPHAKHNDHLVFRLDAALKILSCDLSGVENNINFPINLTGTNYLELVDTCDRIRVAAHFQEALPCYPAPPAVSEPFRLILAANKPPLRVTAHSLLFRAKPTSGESDFIMSTHTVLSDEDGDLHESPAPRPPVGGPLMPSVANGESSSTHETRYRSVSPSEAQLSMNEFDFDTWAPRFQFGEMSCDDTKEWKEPSEAPAPLARAPSVGVDAPPPTPPEEPNRLRSLLSKKPTGDATNSNNILKDLLKQEDEEATSSETSAPHTPHTPGAALSPLQAGPPRAPPPARMPTPSHSMHHHQPHHNSDVLLRILNEKSDEDGEDGRRNSMEGRSSSQPSALLSQLLSNSNGGSSSGRSHDHADNYLDRMACGVKRKFDDSAKTTLNPIKRPTPENQQVSSSAVSATSSTPSSTATSPSTSSSGMSPLCQKNQILVSLLARQQTTPTTPLPLPSPARPAYPPPARPRPPHPPAAQRHHHSTLSNMLTSRASNVNGGGMGAVSQASGGEGSGAGGQSHLQMVLQGAPRAQYPPPTPHPAPLQPLHYANTAPHHIYTNQPQPQSGSSRIASGNGTGGDSEVPSDQTLSDILDEVIDNMPDPERPAPEVNVLGDLEPTRRADYAGVKEKVINAIRQSLMQCEIPVSSSATPPPVYPLQNQVSCTLGGGVPPYSGAEAGRARASGEQQRARLLQLQRSQHMLVSPEAAEQPQADLGSTISALVSATPPNVSLTRTDYAPHHHLYHTPNQMGPNYGTNKITSSQQNPMLSRQLSGSGGSGYAGSGAGGAAAALHTPHSPAATLPPHPHHPHQPQPYHRAPRPHLVGGYYEESGAGYCGELARRHLAPPPHAAAPAPQPPHLATQHHIPCGGGGAAAAGGGTSEYVRNELRAVVGARARPDLHPAMQPDLDSLITFDIANSGGGSVVGVRAGSAAATEWESQQSTLSTTEEVVSGEATSAAGGDEEGARVAGAGAAASDVKASLLQKLLSQ